MAKKTMKELADELIDIMDDADPGYRHLVVNENNRRGEPGWRLTKIVETSDLQELREAARLIGPDSRESSMYVSIMDICRRLNEISDYEVLTTTAVHRKSGMAHVIFMQVLVEDPSVNNKLEAYVAEGADNSAVFSNVYNSLLRWVRPKISFNEELNRCPQE